ncbi:MAG TPA: hypothetical protein VMX17_15690 [Candidatus Glassbacteria bacterium]|nr:hypothetical protein [Candidatus Glassbacteria bacterium]
MKHTPGPWKVHSHSNIDKEQWLTILNGAFDITHNGASNPAIVACSKYSAMTPEENLANAHIMSASPEMYKLLKTREWVLLNGPDYAGTCLSCLAYEHDGHQSDCEYVKAIKKAEGKLKD